MPPQNRRSARRVFGSTGSPMFASLDGPLRLGIKSLHLRARAFDQHATTGRVRRYSLPRRRAGGTLGSNSPSEPPGPAMSAHADPIVILGGGFAGVYAARHLQRRLRGRDIILFSQENHLVFTPLLGN